MRRGTWSRPTTSGSPGWWSRPRSSTRSPRSTSTIRRAPRRSGGSSLPRNADCSEANRGAYAPWSRDATNTHSPTPRHIRRGIDIHSPPTPFLGAGSQRHDPCEPSVGCTAWSNARVEISRWRTNERERDQMTQMEAKLAGTGSRDADQAPDLLARYGCGPVRFTGTADGLFERHLVFDSVLAPSVAGARERFEAFARSVRDVLSQRWIRTEQTYERENPKWVY